MIEHRGRLDGSRRRFGIVVSSFNQRVTRELLSGATACLLEHGVEDDKIEVFRVPGAWEIPALLQRAAESGRFDALIALGAVIRGATPHFDYVAGGAAQGAAAVAAASGVPVAFGVLTTDTLEQALERAGASTGKEGNKGREAALSALEMADLLSKIGGEKP
ncbi:MAG: 6,7-dimethyl-8-ribityllumazine synthase [Longimicrobiaceae bacterium]